MNQKAQEILREADINNRSNIEQENTQINRDWKDTVNNLENRIEGLTGLAQHWEDFEKRLHAFENQLVRLDERNRNVDQVVRSRRHLEDTKNVVQVSTQFIYSCTRIKVLRINLEMILNVREDRK